MSRFLALATTCLLIACPAALAKDVAPEDALKINVPRFSASGTLEQALTQLSELGGAKVLIDWPSLKLVGVTQQTKVAFRTQDATVEQLLDMTLARANQGKPLAWYVDGKVIGVGTQENVIAGYRPDLTHTVAARGKSSATRPTIDRAATRPAVDSIPPASKTAVRGINYDEVPLGDVIKDLRKRTGLNISVNWKSLEEVGIDKDAHISVEAKGITLAKALDVILDAASGSKDKFERLYWIVDENVITIATGNALNVELKTQTMDVGDLMLPIQDQAKPADSIGIAGDRQDSAASDKGRQSPEDALIDAVKDSIGDDMWKPDGRGSIRIHNGKMVISQTPLGFKLLEKAAKKRK